MLVVAVPFAPQAQQLRQCVDDIGTQMGETRGDDYSELAACSLEQHGSPRKMKDAADEMFRDMTINSD